MCRAKQYQENFSNLLIFVTTADENLIHQNTANPSSRLIRFAVFQIYDRIPLDLSNILVPYSKIASYLEVLIFRCFANSLCDICGRYKNIPFLVKYSITDSIKAGSGNCHPADK